MYEELVCYYVNFTDIDLQHKNILQVKKGL